MKPDLDNFERKLLRRILEESTSTVIAHEFGIPKEVVFERLQNVLKRLAASSTTASSPPGSQAPRSR